MAYKGTFVSTMFVFGLFLNTDCHITLVLNSTHLKMFKRCLKKIIKITSAVVPSIFFKEKISCTFKNEANDMQCCLLDS